MAYNLAAAIYRNAAGCDARRYRRGEIERARFSSLCCLELGCAYLAAPHTFADLSVRLANLFIQHWGSWELHCYSLTQLGAHPRLLSDATVATAAGDLVATARRRRPGRPRGDGTAAALRRRPGRPRGDGTAAARRRRPGRPRGDDCGTAAAATAGRSRGDGASAMAATTERRRREHTNGGLRPDQVLGETVKTHRAWVWRLRDPAITALTELTGWACSRLEPRKASGL